MSNELETTAVETNEVHLDKKDLKRLFWRSNGVQSAFNFERMQGLGFCWGMLPVIDKLYKNKEDRVAAYKRHSGYFNTHPWMGGIIYGIVAAMEERKANGEEVDEERVRGGEGAHGCESAGRGRESPERVTNGTGRMTACARWTGTTTTTAAPSPTASSTRIRWPSSAGG